MPLAAALTALLACALLLPAARADAAFPGRNGPLIEARTVETEGQLGGGESKQQLMTLDGRLLYGCVEDQPYEVPNACRQRPFSHPAISPDGRSVAFEEAGGLSVVGSDGSGHRPLGPFTSPVTSPAFAPDGRRLAAVRHSPPTPDGRPRATVVIVRPDGAVRPVAAGLAPDWSVRNWIALIRGGQLYRVRPNGSGLRQLTRRGCWDASWAPDGLRIACARRGGVVTMRADGSDLQRWPGRFDQPTRVEWSPDGRQRAAGDDADALTVVDRRGRTVFRDDNGSNCSAETCWWRHGWTWGPRASR